MGDKKCYIVGAGVDYGLDFEVKDGDFVIAVDGGLNYLQKHGIAVDLTIGDFDSINEKPTQGNVIALDRDKDYSDTFAAVLKGIDEGYETFHIYCGTGGRFDHTLANIQVLSYLSLNNKRGYLIGRDYVVTAITNSSISFDSCCCGTISVFSYTNESAGVCLQGLKYEVENYSLTSSFPIGVSNEFIGVDSTVRVADGTLIIIFPRGAPSKQFPK